MLDLRGTRVQKPARTAGGTKSGGGSFGGSLTRGSSSGTGAGGSYNPPPPPPPPVSTVPSVGGNLPGPAANQGYTNAPPAPPPSIDQRRYTLQQPANPQYTPAPPPSTPFAVAGVPQGPGNPRTAPAPAPRTTSVAGGWPFTVRGAEPAPPYLGAAPPAIEQRRYTLQQPANPQYTPVGGVPSTANVNQAGPMFLNQYPAWLSAADLTPLVPSNFNSYYNMIDPALADLLQRGGDTPPGTQFGGGFYVGPDLYVYDQFGRQVPVGSPTTQEETGGADAASGGSAGDGTSPGGAAAGDTGGGGGGGDPASQQIAADAGGALPSQTSADAPLPPEEALGLTALLDHLVGLKGGQVFEMTRELQDFIARMDPMFRQRFMEILSQIGFVDLGDLGYYGWNTDFRVPSSWDTLPPNLQQLFEQGMTWVQRRSLEYIFSRLLNTEGSLSFLPPVPEGGYAGQEQLQVSGPGGPLINMPAPGVPIPPDVTTA